jgi:4-amino-4-deoxy-L-arabinose transferase-like glycosyltransferase
MVIIWGTTHAGKVDEVPGGMFHVVTRFGHVYYIPLIPTASYIVLEKTADGGFRGADIPLSFKSILAGWLRGGSVIAIIGACIGLAIALFDKKAGPFAWVLPVLIGCFAGVVLLLTYKLAFFTKASYERAMELAQRVGLNDTGLLMLEVAYGRMNAAQAESELARREAQAAAQQPVQAELAEPQPQRFMAQ